MIDLQQIRSVTDFQRNLKEYVGQLKEQQSPLVLTVNGRAEIVVQNAASYQALLDRLEKAETIAAVREGAGQIDRGEGIALEEAENRLRKRHGFSR